MNLGKLSPSDLVELLTIIPLMDAGYEEVQKLLANNPEKMTPSGFLMPSWFEFYELPIKDHIAQVVVLTDQTEEIKTLAASDNPPKAAIQFAKDSMLQTDNEPFADEDRPLIALVFGLGLSIYFSLKTQMTFGFYLNELVSMAGREDKESDKALFNAVKIDPTVLSCTNISNRLSLAVLKNDQKFLKALKRALLGKLTKREQRTYQQQRLVLQVLQEVGAPALSQNDLYELFVNQLNIVTRDRNTDIGDVANNLRQFAYQFMKQKSVSKN